MQYWNLNSHTHFRDTYQQKTFPLFVGCIIMAARRVPKTYVGSIQIFFLVVMQFCAGCWKNSSPHQRNVIWILWVLLDWCRTMVYTSGIRAVKSSKGQFDIYKMPGKLCMKQSAVTAPFLSSNVSLETNFSSVFSRLLHQLMIPTRLLHSCSRSRC